MSDVMERDAFIDKIIGKPVHIVLIEHSEHNVEVRNLVIIPDNTGVLDTPLDSRIFYRIGGVHFISDSDGNLLISREERVGLRHLKPDEAMKVLKDADYFTTVFQRACDGVYSLIEADTNGRLKQELGNYSNHELSQAYNALNLFIKSIKHNVSFGLESIRHAVYHTMEKRGQLKPGYVYLVRAVTPHNHYKIGLSKKPIKRISRLDVTLPFPIEITHLIPTDHCFKAEKMLHEKYKEQRLNGEWFELGDQDIEDICQIKSLNFFGASS